MKKFALACALMTAPFFARVADAAINLSDYNLITTGNLTDQSDVQGRVLVGGTLNTNNFNFGGQLSGTNLNPPAGIFNALAGNVSNLNNNGKNFIFGSGNTVNGVSANPSATANYTNGLPSYLANVSSAYAGLTTNSAVNANDRNQISFAATPTTINGQSVAVFSLTSSFFTTGGTVSSLTGVAAGTTVVINVTGPASPLSFSSGLNFAAFSNAANEANVIFNFINATALNGLNNLGGSILAPNADLNTTSTLRGSIYVKSVSSVGEIDLARSQGTTQSGFSGFTPNVAAVPEPSSLAMCVIASLVGVGLTRKRMARKAA